MPSPPLFNDYLMHFCGKEKTPQQAQEVLESILRRGHFIPSRCPLFFDPDEALEKRGRQAWAEMVCFTDLRFQDLHHHVEKFGPYGVAIKKDSHAAQCCSPVHYVPVNSDATHYAKLLESGVEELLRLQQMGSIDPKWEFPRQLQEFDRRRVASLQDIRTRDENEWRFIATRQGDLMLFAPADVSFLLVETFRQASQWNNRLNDPGDKSLAPYGQAGVLAIPVELLLGRDSTAGVGDLNKD